MNSQIFQTFLFTGIWSFKAWPHDFWISLLFIVMSPLILLIWVISSDLQPLWFAWLVCLKTCWSYLSFTRNFFNWFVEFVFHFNFTSYFSNLNYVWPSTDSVLFFSFDFQLVFTSSFGMSLSYLLESSLVFYCRNLKL